MGLFKTPEEKEKELLTRYGLDGLTNPKDVESVKSIASNLVGAGLMDAGMKIGMSAKVEDQLQVMYQKAIMEQNFIIIRKLCEISEKLK